MPGLIDAHVHLAFDGSPEPVKQIKSNKDSFSEVILEINNAEKQIKAGVTTIRDCGSPNFVPVEIARAAENGLLAKAPHVLVSGPVICITGGHGYFVGFEADGLNDLNMLKNILSVWKSSKCIIENNI